MNCDNRFFSHRYAHLFHRVFGVTGHRSSRLLFFITLFLSVVALVLAFPHQKTARQTPYVVLFGDSITANWQSLTQTKDATGLRIANRGFSGDFTIQMLSRFEQDVVQLHPNVVVILGGTNDILRGNSSDGLQQTEQNLESMAAIAKKNAIGVVIATLPPSGNCSETQAAARTASDTTKIRQLNDWIKNFAQRKGYALADYYAVLADERSCYLKGTTTDGIHPNSEGYGLIEPVVLNAIQSAMQQRK